MLNEKFDNFTFENSRFKKKFKKTISFDAKNELNVFFLKLFVVRNIVFQWLNNNVSSVNFNASFFNHLNFIEFELLKFLIFEFEKFGFCWFFLIRKKKKIEIKTILKLLKKNINKNVFRWVFEYFFNDLNIVSKINILLFILNNKYLAVRNITFIIW